MTTENKPLPLKKSHLCTELSDCFVNLKPDGTSYVHPQDSTCFGYLQMSVLQSSSDQIPLENTVCVGWVFFSWVRFFFILDLHSITSDQDFLLIKHCGETLFNSSGSRRVVLENIYCLINSLCQIRHNPRYVFAVLFWSYFISGTKYVLQF